MKGLGSTNTSCYHNFLTMFGALSKPQIGVKNSFVPLRSVPQAAQRMLLPQEC